MVVILAVVVSVASEYVLEVGGSVVLGSVSGVGVLLAAGVGVVGVLPRALGLLLLGVGLLLMLGGLLLVVAGLLWVLLSWVGVVGLLLGCTILAGLWLVAAQLAVGVELRVAVGVGLDDTTARAVGADMRLVGLSRVRHLAVGAGAWRCCRLVLGGSQWVALVVVADEAVVALLGLATGAQGVALLLGFRFGLVVGGWLVGVGGHLVLAGGWLELTGGHLEARCRREPVGVLGGRAPLHGGSRVPEHGVGVVARC
ncbi:hypothetical protein AALO_G00213480 [Alosa alosa]|uniref:Uncharacterized protein n=1 Tax=Alosa alosa TaxID=278164 RepID=A0AAV6G079_9TELE|nr:hypothetical protein AALO_G00213480 [Alosa alosa]